jgi:peptidoglycan/LPS O-acetylase OafA/YrhL
MLSFGHTWSLAVEEQFYIIWPVVPTPCSDFGSRRGRSSL